MAIPPADACRRRLSYNGVVAESLLQTKLHIPVTRGQLVVRPRLLAQLAGGLTGRLTLLSAPAGFGKTTLVAAWARGLKAQAGPALAWLSLDEADNELGRFCRYLCAALAQVDASLELDVTLIGNPFLFTEFIALGRDMQPVQPFDPGQEQTPALHYRWVR